jgi:hypothetical protein
MSTEARHQSPDLHSQAITVVALAVLLLIVMAAALVRLLATLHGTPTAAATRNVIELPPLSATDARTQLQEYERAQAARLNSYGWDDSKHEFAHVPIERAMQLLLQQPQLEQPSKPPPARPASAKPRSLDVPRSPDRPAPLAPR